MEIERKFLVKEMPEHLENYEQLRISQGYICTNPVVRIRRSNDDYYLTYKGEGILAREEYNLPLNAEAFEHMLPKVDGILIDKIRYNIPLEGKYVAELDVFLGQLEPLRLVEVEFDTVEEALAFIPPAWFGDDVTELPEYYNSNLSKKSSADE